MKAKLPENSTRSLAWMLLLIFVSELIAPSIAFAGGPDQPEVHGFTPIGMSDMVDPFTGDFSYNIPLMDVEGYPINIAYNGEVTMDQEASWVGLGWNLNVGSVVRSMRGIPDDFNGETVQHTTYMKPNRTIGLDVGAAVELFGKSKKKKLNDDDPLSLSASLGVNYNNYTGFATQFSFGPSFNFAKANGHSMTAGFQLSGSSENGAGFAPSLSFQKKTELERITQKSLSATIGSALNSRAGLSYISYKASYFKLKTDDKKKNSSFGFNETSYDLGLNSYSPSSGPSMFGLSLSGSVKLGPDFTGFDGTFDLGISYSSQWIPKDQVTIETPSYGYFYLENGQQKEKAQLDFNRDNDGSFTKYTPNLPSTFMTYDIFSIQAQGAGGSYRAFRNEVGYVFDPKVTTSSASGSFGFEAGIGNVAKFGADFSVNYTNSHTGGWTGFLNQAKNTVKFEPAATGLETYAMQNASESSVDSDPLMSSMGGSKPSFFPLFGDVNAVYADDKLKTGPAFQDLTGNNRTSRIKRNELLQFLTHGELADHSGLDDLHPQIHSGAKNHHIGQVTQLGTDGRRYVFGIAAYNHFQEETTFAVGKTLDGTAGIPVTDYFGGLIDYSSVNAAQLLSPDNPYGIDNYYSSSTTPAYAHSFLLTAVLSDDYIDSDPVKGPSQDDMGAYVKFDYEKVDNYEWRSPMQDHTAFRNEGMKSDLADDKASFVYGKKDLWYVKAIETKNYIAVFELEDRLDAASSDGRHGGTNTAKNMKLLRRILLYAKPDYDADSLNAVPLQVVHFEYDYQLCQDYPGNAFPVTAGNQGGKLTLKEIWFSYQGSGRMKRSSYTFEYAGLNPSYNMKAVDRWGNYKPTSSGTENTTSTPMNNADYPYTDQNNTNTDNYVAAWSMTAINLPSGGRIEIGYESDDYAYVQHLQAMQMFPIVGTSNSIADNDPDLDDFEVHSVSDNGDKNQFIYFKMKPGFTDVNDYVKPGQFLYFRCLVDFRDAEAADSPTKYDYVSGYGMVGEVSTVVHNGTLLGRIGFIGERLQDSGASEYNPISKFAIQFGRMQLSRYITESGVGDPSAENSEQGLTDFANSVVGAFASFEELFDGPNKVIWEKERGRNIVMNKSFIRLYEPSHKKLGGGHRVKQIRMYDNWDGMTGNANAGYYYGQDFSYTLPDGTSSGVASYEPQVGGDENPWHRPIAYSNKIRWGTDNKLYQEEPLMESQFPSPSIGYSRITVSDLERAGVVRTATGKVVKEFYTAKDFPTIVKASDVDLRTSNSFLPFLPKYQLLTASQGFTIELNDMHGKPKKESVYAQANDDGALSTVDYFYQQAPLNLDGITNYRLTNNVKTINAQGVQASAEIGVKYEAVADFRESATLSAGGSIDLNVNSFMFGFIPIVVPIAWPALDISNNQFHSTTLNKVVNRFGILEKIVANQDGSVVETNNLAYDAETGEVLSTQTTTNFNDKIYSMNYPAYWHYDQMGQAYKNIGIQFGNGIDFSSSGFAAIPTAGTYFVAGDELAVSSSNGAFPAFRGWVVSVAPAGISVVSKSGAPVTVQNATVKVIRSGRKNKQTVSMASLTSLGSPLNGIGSNAYASVLNAGAVEFSQVWKTYCDCFKDEGGDPTTTNPYVMGTLGNWRPVKSYTHLSGRTQSDFDNNTNIRKDGVFTSYTPYYKLINGTWVKNPLNWTYVSEVTAFSPNGMTLETRDALGRYSASLFGYNNTLTTAVAANTRLEQLVFAGFEDIDYTNCSDQQIRLVSTSGIEQIESEAEMNRTDAHTGRNSMKVMANKPIKFTLGAPACEETGCRMSIDFDNEPEVINGQAPYQLEVEVITGSVDAVMSGATIVYTGDYSNYYEMILTVTDANGCKVIQPVKKQLD